MISWLLYWYRAIKYHDVEKDQMAELLEITVKHGRRAAYDLKHCVSDFEMVITRPSFAEHYIKHNRVERYEHKSSHYLTLFNRGRGTKDYRIRMHGEMDELERKIDRLESQIRELGGTPAGDEIPF